MKVGRGNVRTVRDGDGCCRRAAELLLISTLLFAILIAFACKHDPRRLASETLGSPQGQDSESVVHWSGFSQ